MKTIKHKKLILFSLIILGVLLLILNNGIIRKNHMKETELYLAVSPYIKGEAQWQAPEKIYEEGTGEVLFIKAMNAFDAKDFSDAKVLFEQALTASHTDSALPAYCYYYINECIFYTNGIGDFDIVEKTLVSAANCHAVANDRDMLWTLISRITVSATDNSDIKETSKKAIELMEDYIHNNDHLELSTWARMKNSIAMLEYFNKEYASCMRNLYDVELALEFEKQTPAVSEELRYAQEYLVNLYYIFEDYETAISMYRELIEKASEEGIDAQFSYYVNMSTAYMETGQTDNALKTIEELQKLTPQLSEESAPEVNATINNILVDIYLAKNDYAKAEEHFFVAEEFFKNNTAAIFIGNEYQVMLSKGKLLVAQGKYEDAEKHINSLLVGDAAHYISEKDIYELLLTLYQKTNNKDKIIEYSNRLLALNVKHSKTTSLQYLEFSRYYQESKHLENANYELVLHNIAFTFAIFISIAIIVIISLFAKRLRTKNLTDQLTGLYNRKKLNLLKRKYKYNGTPGSFGVIMLDIDYFKKYNDTCGHPAGDEILKKVAAILLASVRNKDTVIRYGGEEFLILLSKIDAKTATNVCQRIKHKLDDSSIPHPASDVSDHITLSMGLCHQKEQSELSLEQLIEAADECLYKSKESGRNRFTSKEQ